MKARLLTENDLAYELLLYKNQKEKHKDHKNMKELHTKSCLTAKYLTKQLVESNQPIQFLLSRHESINSENVRLVMTRC